MRAIQIAETGSASQATVVELPTPERGAGEVLVEVRAVAAGFPDLLMAQGRYHLQPETPFVLGSDFAGVVLEAPEDSHFAAGDRVAGFMDHGAAAEVVSVPPDRVYRLPDRFGFAEGSALPMNYLTAHFALAARGQLAAGDTVLVHGASGGVGVAAIQVARGLGATTIAVVSSEAKAEVARAAGADHVIGREDVPSRPRSLTGGRGVDLVIDVVGGDLMTDSLRSLATFGRVMVVGFASGEIPLVKVNRLLMNNIDVRGVEASYAFDHGHTPSQWEQLVPMMESGIISPIIHSVQPFEDFADALGELEGRRVMGRAVLLTARST